MLPIARREFPVASLRSRRGAPRCVGLPAVCSGLAAALLYGAAAAACAQDAGRPAGSGLRDWPRSRPWYHHTAAGRYTGSVAAVLVGDTRFPAPSDQALAYVNLWQRAPSEKLAAATGNWLVPQQLALESTATSLIGRHLTTRTDDMYFGRLLVDCRRPEVQRWIRVEAQRVLTGGYQFVFFDNANMRISDTFAPTAADAAARQAQLESLADPAYHDSMAAAVTAWRTECQRMGLPMTMAINLARPWIAPRGAASWREAVPRVLDYWWGLGVRGACLEAVDHRDPASDAYQCNVEFGRAWLARGGTLYVIITDEARGAALAPAWDSDHTLVWLRH